MEEAEKELAERNAELWAILLPASEPAQAKAEEKERVVALWLPEELRDWSYRRPEEDQNTKTALALAWTREPTAWEAAIKVVGDVCSLRAEFVGEPLPRAMVAGIQPLGRRPWTLQRPSSFDELWRGCRVSTSGFFLLRRGPAKKKSVEPFTGAVYAIRRKSTKRVEYVGKSAREPWSRLLWHMNSFYHTKGALYDTVAEAGGWEHFEVAWLQLNDMTKATLAEREQWAMDALHPVANVAQASAGDRGLCTEEFARVLDGLVYRDLPAAIRVPWLTPVKKMRGVEEGDLWGKRRRENEDAREVVEAIDARIKKHLVADLRAIRAGTRPPP